MALDRPWDGPDLPAVKWGFGYFGTIPVPYLVGRISST